MKKILTTLVVAAASLTFAASAVAWNGVTDLISCGQVDVTLPNENGQAWFVQIFQDSTSIVNISTPDGPGSASKKLAVGFRLSDNAEHLVTVRVGADANRNDYDAFTGYVTNCGPITGTPGPAGPKGDKGDKGDKGESGTQGVKGDKGETGTPGTNGTNGSNGTSGERGATGSKGDKGDRGSDGSQGPVGPAGKDGTNGKDGTPAVAGPAGKAGKPGVAGKAGLRGRAGSPGARGKAGICLIPKKWPGVHKNGVEGAG